jgi:hypothetical protein
MIDFHRDYLAWFYVHDGHGRRQLWTIRVLPPRADGSPPAAWVWADAAGAAHFRLTAQEGHFLTYDPAPDRDAAADATRRASRAEARQRRAPHG